MRETMEHLRILGIRVDNVSMKEAVSYIKEKIETNEQCVVVTPNSEIVVQAGENERLKRFIDNADLVVPDGSGLVLASKIKKTPLKERVTGIDLMKELLEYAHEKDHRVYFLGGKPGIAELAKEKLVAEFPDLNVVGAQNGYYKGFHSGYPGHEEERAVLEDIRDKRPHMLFVGLGSPKQDYFIENFKDELDCNLYMGVGGSFDVYSETLKRAPKRYQDLGLEWLYRIVKEPWRLKRAGAIPTFLFRVIFSKKQ